MCSGNEFHAAGPACEKARSPHLVRSCGSEKSVTQSTTLTSDVDHVWSGRLAFSDYTVVVR